MSRHCGILNISQHYRPPRTVTEIALLYGDGVCFLWGTNWTVSTATSSQYLQLSVSRLSRHCGILNISQHYRPPRTVTEIALLYGDEVCFLWGTNWTVSIATSSQYFQLTVSRLSRQCEILNISQPYRPPRSVTGITLFCFFFTVDVVMFCGRISIFRKKILTPSSESSMHFQKQAWILMEVRKRWRL
jgi:hypothetical protein